MIADLDDELRVLRARVSGHDQRCRSVHMAAANRIGGGWPALLRGYLAVLHYTDHTIADLEDVNLLYLQTFHSVIADGRVSDKELRKLVAACNQVQRALGQVYAQAGQVQLNAPLAQALGKPQWSQCLPEFGLVEADDDNINAWMKAAGSWVQVTLDALGALRDASLEELLRAENAVAGRLRNGDTSPTDDTPVAAPTDYPTRLPGEMRQRDLRQNLWQRFLAADGVFPSVARVAVAASIVAGVLWAGGAVGMAEVVAYNGLQQTVTVAIDGQSATIPANDRHVFRLSERSTHHVETRTANGATIESFDAPSGGHGGQFAYNVAGAALLLNWRASYGSASEDTTRSLSTTRWERTQAQDIFSEPPQKVSGKGGQYRDVLTAVSGRSPHELLGELGPERDLALITAHARWDDADSAYLEQWMEQLRRATGRACACGRAPAAQPARRGGAADAAGHRHARATGAGVPAADCRCAGASGRLCVAVRGDPLPQRYARARPGVCRRTGTLGRTTLGCSALQRPCRSASCICRKLKRCTNRLHARRHWPMRCCRCWRVCSVTVAWRRTCRAWRSSRHHWHRSWHWRAVSAPRARRTTAITPWPTGNWTRQ